MTESAVQKKPTAVICFDFQRASRRLRLAVDPTFYRRNWDASSRLKTLCREDDLLAEVALILRLQKLNELLDQRIEKLIVVMEPSELGFHFGASITKCSKMNGVAVSFDCLIPVPNKQH